MDGANNIWGASFSMALLLDDDADSVADVLEELDLAMTSAAVSTFFGLVVGGKLVPSKLPLELEREEDVKITQLLAGDNSDDDGRMTETGSCRCCCCCCCWRRVEWVANENALAASSATTVSESFMTNVNNLNNTYLFRVVTMTAESVVSGVT